MPNSAILLKNIVIAPPAAQIYSRLGFKRATTSLSSGRRRETDRHMEEAASMIRLQGSFLRLSIRRNDGRLISLQGRTTFRSEKLSAFLGDCRDAVLMGATAGKPIMDAIAEETARGNLTAAVVYDATASEMTDAALDWIMNYVNGQLRREGRRLLPRRFSAGYADFSLSSQKVIHKKLRMEEIGVSITPACILQPEKFVTAIGAIP